MHSYAPILAKNIIPEKTVIAKNKKIKDERCKKPGVKNQVKKL